MITEEKIIELGYTLETWAALLPLEQLLFPLGITLEEWNNFGAIEKLFVQVSDRLSTISDLVWIDLEAGQLEIPAESYPVQFPCALIDFPQVEFSDETHNNQQALIYIKVRIGIDLYEDLHMIDGNPTPEKGTAVKRLQLITKVHKVLQGFETDECTPLTRGAIEMERRDDGIKVIGVTYGTAAKDDTAADEYEEQVGSSLEVRRG